MPDPFTAIGSEAEQTAWLDFELNLLAWLGVADPGFETDLQWISEHADTEFDMDVHADDMAAEKRTPFDSGWTFEEPFSQGASKRFWT